ncbi:ribosomal maturation YjgA family protein [Stenotrophomonas humi]
MSSSYQRLALGFSWPHAVLALVVFVVEVIIATQLPHVSWIRAYLGDVLVVVLIYATARSVLRVNDYLLLLAVFVFACCIESAQYFRLAERLGFVRGDVMYTVIGNTFSWGDIVCYAVGCAMTAWLVFCRNKLVSRQFTQARRAIRMRG